MKVSEGYLASTKVESSSAHCQEPFVDMYRSYHIISTYAQLCKYFVRVVNHGRMIPQKSCEDPA